jgi:23S rRNA (pseudouridine1915-N3)-methyltransferase
MLRIKIIAVGKLKERFWADACAEYLKRLKAYATVEVCEVPDIDPAKAGGESAAVEREGESILRAIPQGAHVCLLAIEGKRVSSEQFSEAIEAMMVGGTSTCVFVIGGSCGVSASVYARANSKVSFGAITLPHNLARVVLLEQIYRAFKIMLNEPYHK